MKRVLTALLATAAGVLWLVTYRVTPVTLKPLAGAQPASSPDQPAEPAPAATAKPGPTPTPAPTSTAAGSYTGSDIQTIFGDVQVKVVVSGGKITDVQPLHLPYDRARSALISQYAEPMLRQETIQVQGYRIDVVSGATYTSEAWAESVAAALRQAHLA